ncbi:aldo/keto reductase [Acuticoccus sp. MNP-M23]|nr:aldo/keto reductase [Acuticoccus sp. MNP-M23]WMS45111.1 aldo/keto reductase [Acuticoccus sp. MNP-M23]
MAALPRQVLAQGAGATRVIPSTGAAVPVIGLGTWITFNVGRDPVLLERSTDVMRAFFAEGGGVIDSSPMYGSAQATVGHGLAALGQPETLFAADKVWTSSGGAGSGQIASSREAWRTSFDLLQVHNLVAWEAHLETLFAKKAAGEIDYVGVTTSHGRRHGEMERIMARHPLDFVQLTYNALDRTPEARLLPLAQEKGIGVIVNRPFRRGALVGRVRGAPLPAFAGALGAESWAQLLLKFIVSHPAVTVTIPATTSAQHMRENKAAARGVLPDAAQRAKIAATVAAL